MTTQPMSALVYGQNFIKENKATSQVEVILRMNERNKEMKHTPKFQTSL